MEPSDHDKSTGVSSRHMTVLVPSVRALKTNQRVWDSLDNDNGNMTSAYSAVGIGSAVDFCGSPGQRLENAQTSSTVSSSRSSQNQQQQRISPIRNLDMSSPFLVSDAPWTTPGFSPSPFSPPFPLRLPTALSQCHATNQKEEHKTRPKPKRKRNCYSYPSPIRKPRGGYARLSAERWMKNSKEWSKKNQPAVLQSCQTQLQQQQPHNNEAIREITVNTAHSSQRGVPRPPSPISVPKQVASNGGPVAGDGYRKTDSGFAALPLLVSLRPDDGQEVWAKTESAVVVGSDIGS